MGKLRRKSTACFNCGTSLLNGENYCPNCGQENHAKQASTTLLIKDFVDTYLSFDSKLFVTLRPLMFSPGTLSKEYLDGKRVKFVPPIRLFIFLSFLYFFVSFLFGGDSGFRVEMSDGTARDQQDFVESFQRNINVLILLFTPIHALILMLLFRSEKRKFYVNYFVFTLHIFSLFFVIGILLHLILRPINAFVENASIADPIVWSILLATLVYILIYSIRALRITFEKKYTTLRFIGTLLLSLVFFILAFAGYIFFLLLVTPVGEVN